MRSLKVNQSRVEIRRLKLLCKLLALLVIVIATISGQVLLSAFAESYEITNVLTDLQKDSNFDINDYPVNGKDYSLSVIQVAEGADGSLYLYTYQPCQNTKYLVATDIDMSLTDKMGGIVTDDLSDIDKPKLFNLTLVDTSGVFVKYKVDGFTVSTDPVRYYNISTIYRKWIEGIDKETGNDNIKKAVSFPVGKCFKVETVGGELKYSCKNVDVVEIKNPYVDYLSFYEGLGWDFLASVLYFTDVHYVAFSTDKKIDTLKEADVTYTTCPYTYWTLDAGTYSCGEESKPKFKTLTGDMVLESSQYSWDCILRTEDFIAKADLNSATENEVKKCEYVLVFLTTKFTETEHNSFTQGHGYDVSGTKVSNISILRLKFETDGVTYNLGAVMDKLEADDIPGNVPVVGGGASLGFWEYIWRCIVRLFNGTATLVEQIVAVIALFFCLLALPILLTVLSLCIPAFGAVMKTILKAILTGLKYLLIGLWYIVSAPFRFIAWLIRKIKKE